jgi:hypothetical protein
VLSNPLLYYKFQSYIYNLCVTCVTETSVNCSFEDAYFCGYMNQSTTPWTQVDYADSSYKSSSTNKTGMGIIFNFLGRPLESKNISFVYLYVEKNVNLANIFYTTRSKIFLICSLWRKKNLSVNWYSGNSL